MATRMLSALHLLTLRRIAPPICSCRILGARVTLSQSLVNPSRGLVHHVALEVGVDRGRAQELERWRCTQPKRGPHRVPADDPGHKRLLASWRVAEATRVAGRTGKGLSGGPGTSLKPLAPAALVRAERPDEC